MLHQQTNILVIGAGAAGLMAARDLARAGKSVTIIEARNRLGGRIHTFTSSEFSAPVELGAEFMHGDVPLTKELLREASITYQDPGGKNYEVGQGHAQETGDYMEDLPLLLDTLYTLSDDMPLAAFLTQYFPEDRYQLLRDQATRFAEGYDAADSQRASVFALRDEWSGGGAEDSPRPLGGYGGLLQLLAQQLQAAGGTIELGTVVQAVHWQPGHVEVRCDNDRYYQAQQVVLTVPLGVLQATEEQPGYVAFVPELSEKRTAAAAMGFGAIIKVLFEFDEAFWEHSAAELAQPLSDLGFLFSDAPIPTWWAQLPDPRPLLTGWLGGPTALHLRDTPDEVIIEQALESLAYIFTTTPAYLRAKLRGQRVANWAADPFALGAYTYSTVDTATARLVLLQPIEQTLFFAGEAVYAGPALGTVEAALQSGKDVAASIINQQLTPSSSEPQALR
ncbi:NAD(P)/FAD-dependent oxidoreductase [Hymenobacter sp. GOD-10R]|uniref:flavin monoamine oxidase family protein n=1 Tax=Hymenobacter sp. GOD-10R TaxID=3093922 RepID=UPI002D783E44|nr:NAD(P)/FAD-dependent oxidoreductase [Hymenobacter sp. GOD-10R]WRQ30331.1 NAD(P)/FAD-dependent oxidoreductase [Hymenobacter sp. GOD-10R]